MRPKIRKYCRNRVLALVIFSMSISSLAFAADQAAVEAEQSVIKSARQLLQTTITYSCTDLPIEEVLMDLAELAKIDIIKSPKVTGNVTAKVTNKPLGEVLTNILAAHDYTYIATESMIRVVPISEITLAKEELVSKVYRITYADANDVATALAGFVSANGRVAINRGTSHIVVTDTEYKIRAVDRFVEELDRETPQVLVEVRIYEITTKEGFDLETAWHAARNVPLKTIERVKTTPDSGSMLYPTGVTETFTPGYTAQSTEVREGDEFGYENAIRTGTDPFQEQRLFKDAGVDRTDTLTEVTPDVTTTETTYDQLLPSYTREYYRTRRRKPFVGGSFDRIEGGSLSFSLLNDAVDIDFVLSILQSQVEAKLLANPRILVVDNETANFEIVREVPYRELLQVAREDPVTYTAFKNVGVNLKVTPHVARDGMIKLHLMPEFGVLVSQDAVNVSTRRDNRGQDVHQYVLGVPTVEARRADTIALVRDGQTVAIGGLRRRQTSKDISKVPVLGDMPLVGGLFKSETELEQISELVVFITTRIVTRPELSQTAPLESHSMQMQEEVRNVYEPRKRDTFSHNTEQGTDNKNPEIMMSLAGAHLKAGRYELAIELLRSVTQIQPYNNTAYQYLGYCHLRLDNMDEAIENYSRAIELNDKDWEAHRGLGVTYMIKARETEDELLKAKAVHHCRLSLDIYPAQPNGDLLLRLIEEYSSD